MTHLTSKTSRTIQSQIRVSVGTAIVMNLLRGKLDAAPTTAYLMTFKLGKCTANCGFCPQAKSSQSKAEMLSRVSWPAFPTQKVINRLVVAVQAGEIKRVCIQALNYPQVFEDLCKFVKALKQKVSVPVSVSCQPLDTENMWSLAQAGVDRIGIAIDAATEKIFDQVKGEGVSGPYKWRNEFVLLRAAIGIFGEGNASTHLIVGLGETEKEAVALLQQCVDMGVSPALFTFTPIQGTTLSNSPRPLLAAYRRVQLARYIIVNSFGRLEDMSFGEGGEIMDFGVGKDTLLSVVETGKPFITSGCVDCNRPFYNEKPSGPIYNYPRPLTAQEISTVKEQLNLDF